MSTLIEILLINDDPKDIKRSRIGSSKIEIIQIPRNKLSENFNQLNFDGIYFLVDSLKQETSKIYIGKGLVKNRINCHDKNEEKDFWNLAFAVRLNNDCGFNDTQISYLEYYFINKAKEVNISILDNNNIPTQQILSDYVKSDLEKYIADIEILLSTLGLKSFQFIENKNIKASNIFYCKDNYGSEGIGEYTEDGFLLYKDSKCKLELHKGTGSVKERDRLLKEGKLREENNQYILVENTLLKSVSAASGVVLGRASNGWEQWKNQDGVTLDKIIRKNI